MGLISRVSSRTYRDDSPAMSTTSEVVQTLAAASAEYSCEPGTAKFYAYCAVGGAASCGLTHTAVVPLDLVKCRIQVDPAKYKGIGPGFKITLAEDGVKGLAKG